MGAGQSRRAGGGEVTGAVVPGSPAASAVRQKVERVRAMLLGRIEDGTLPPGALVPGTAEAAGAAGVSRTYACAALRELLAEGVLAERVLERWGGRPRARLVVARPHDPGDGPPSRTGEANQ